MYRSGKYAYHDCDDRNDRIREMNIVTLTPCICNGGREQSHCKDRAKYATYDLHTQVSG
jgi:hypothetical protein